VSIDIRSFGSNLAASAGVAQRTFFGTVFAAVLGGLALSALSYIALREQHWVYGTLAVALAMVEALVAGLVLGGKRAMAMGTVDSITRLQLGRVFVGSLFDRIMNLVEGEQAGERGHVVTKGAERIPLAKAEDLLRRAVQKLTGDTEGAGWLRRKIQTRLTTTVEKYTLARFRDENAQHGGVDLVKVREELERMADNALAQRLLGGVKAATMLVAIGLPLLVALQTWLLAALGAKG
jgi:hypothetical protein